MGRYIMKADREHDLYVEWSTIVDAPVGWGPLEDLTSDPDWGHTFTPERLAWLEEKGTSVMVRYGSGTFEGSFGDVPVFIRELGDGSAYQLPRENLYDFIMALAADPDSKQVQQSALDRYAERIIHVD
jgi:hypothetical protein